jgi:membrane-bound lytic murein transglycosylase D
MIKKYLITCSGMFVLGIVANLFIFCTSAPNEESSFKFGDFPKPPAPGRPASTLSFANEEMPIDDPNVLKRLKKALRAYNFQNQQTYMLHKRAKEMFPLVDSILKAYRIPEDFKYIPLVESGFEKGTSSYRGASGYWQFMPGTARRYGLRVDGKVDERQDIRKSTIAACKYLRSIYKEFKSWTLVAAAYNIGEDNLHAQIRRQDENNYFKMQLNRETGSYVYNLISMKEIIQNPSKYGYAQRHKRITFSRAYPRPVTYIADQGEKNQILIHKLF